VKSTSNNAPPPRRRARRRILAWAGGATALLAVVLWYTADGTSVGHFASASDKDRFMAAYGTAMAALPNPAQTRDIVTTFGVVRVYRFTGADDDSTPLLLLPGRAAPTPVWADNLPGLLALRSVYTLDLLGEPGMSIQARPITNDADQAAWLHEVLAKLPEAQVHLVGLSIGGWTAMNLAVHRPEKIASLTLIEPVFVFASMSVEAIVRSIPASVPWLPKTMRDDFNSWTAGGAPVRHEPVGDMIEAGMGAYRLKLPLPGRPDPATVAALPMPVLVILAGASPMHDTAAAAAEARRLLPRGTVKVYAGASHAISGERPAEIAKDVAAHMDRSGR
jgi:pimeloyl-ACP methyl ester carboxylesterase